MLLFETAIRQYLALDPEIAGQLAKFSGKVVKVEFTDINKEIFLFPGANGIELSDEYEGHVDTIVRGTLIALFKMGVAKNAADILLKGEVEIIGDTHLGHQFKNIFSNMDIDWSEPLVNLFGDSVAYQAQQTAKQFGQWGKASIQSLSMSISEYLQEESRDVVTETELDIFNNAVDKLRNDADRLQAKMYLVLNSEKNKTN